MVLPLGLAACATTSTAKAEHGVTVAGQPLARNLSGAVVTFAPHCEVDTCRGMYVVVDNRTPMPVFIDWARATFFVNGNPKGGFLGDGENVERTSLSKLAPLEVAPQSTFTATLSPITTSTFEESQGWTTAELPQGKISARFVVRKQGIPYTGMYDYNIVPRAAPGTH